MSKNKKLLTTKEEIVKEAAILFAQRGFFGVSMQDIATKLKITKAALYYHFPSKENLYQAILEKTFKDLSSKLRKAFQKGKTPWDILLNAIEAYLFFSLKRPEVNLFFQEEHSTQDRQTARIIELFRRQLLSFFKKIIKTEAKGRQLAEKQVIFLATLLLTILGKSIMIATLPPRFVAKQILTLILPQPRKGKDRSEKKIVLSRSQI